MRAVIYSTILLLMLSCGNKGENRDIASTRPNYQHYNWSGEYTFNDSVAVHQLTLLRGRVDADYQVMYTTNTNGFGGSIWKANDFDDSIQIVFINNFSENAANVPFVRGDVLFTLVRDTSGNISTQWFKVSPAKAGTFALTGASRKPN
jgi:hypothetical protein